MDLFVDNSVIMMKLMKLMKMLQFSLFFRKMWSFSVKFSDQVFPDAEETILSTHFSYENLSILPAR